MAVVKARAKIAGEDRRVSVASDLLVPMHIRELSSGIFDVIRAYYKWADLPGNFQSDAKRLLEYTDRNISTDDYISFIKDMFMRQFPNQSASETRHLLQFANDFYAKRGTAEAYKFLFKALYNDDVELFYPSKYLFKSSDGVWVKNTILKCLGTDLDIVNVVGRRLWGVESSASALIKKVIFYAAGSDLVAEMTVTGVKGEFAIDEILETRDAQPQIKSHIFAQIGSYAINNPGRGYRAGAILPLVGGDGTGLTATIGEVDDRGVILTVNIVSSGIGYVYSIPTVNMNDPNLFDRDLPVEDRIVADIAFDNSTAYTTPGEFETLRSAPSNIFRLYDGDYYQDFSYVLRTNVPLVTFEEPLLALLHPAGTSMFVQPSIVCDASRALNNTGSFLYQYSKPDGVNYDNPAAESGRKYFDVLINLNNPLIQRGHEHSSYMVLSNKNLFIANKFKTANVASEEVRSYVINKSIDYEVDVANFTTLDKIGNSSKFLWEIGAKKMDELGDLSTMYGLSPTVAYSNITLSP